MAGTEPHAWGTGRVDDITYDDITYVGLAVPKATVWVALVESGGGGEVRQLGVFENRPEILCKMAARLGKAGRRLSFCYEAGPCGYGLDRLLTACGHSCTVPASQRRSGAGTSDRRPGAVQGAAASARLSAAP